MPTHYDKTARTGDEGVDFISLTCTRSNALFLERPRQDVGIDGHIELLNRNGEPTGAIAFVQVKAGLSYVSKSNHYRIKADKEHFETWAKYANPVLGIIYNPTIKDAYWVSISDYIHSHPSCINTGPYIIEAPVDQLFSEQEFSKLETYVEEEHAKLGAHSPQLLINQYFSASLVTKFECLSQLFSLYRWTPLVCFFLHQTLRIEEELSLIRELTYFISFYRNYGDRMYGGHNTMPDNPILNSLAQQCINGFGKTEVLKMISIIDENGYERGSIGQLVAIQLGHVSNIKDVLCEIAEDRILEPEVRCYAIAILIEFTLYLEASFYKPLLQNEGDNLIIEALCWALEVISLSEEDEYPSHYSTTVQTKVIYTQMSLPLEGSNNI